MNTLVFTSALTLFLGLSIQKAKQEKSLVLIKGRCGDDPSQIAAKNGLSSVGADANNISTLVSILKNAGADSAFVSGWNGQPGSYVLRDNGALAPYQHLTNDTEYAFAYRPCPCPPHGTPQPICPPQPNGHRPVYVPQHQQTTYPSQPICPPQPFYPPQQVCPTRPICSRGSSSSESSEISGNKCRLFPNKVVCVKKGPIKLKDGDKLCFEKQKIETIRNYEVCFDPRFRGSHSGRDHRKVKVKVTENKLEKDVKFVELSRNIKYGSERNCEFPDFLRCPEVLAGFAKYLASRACAKPCFYVGGRDCNELFVELNCEFFKVAISPKTFCCGRIPFHKIKLCPVYGTELHHLIKKGLAGVNLVVPVDC
ncbi:hypothetical protein H312_00592 [Anncaliia algerae PRA339]|uniref:Uncharacterized protein n=1 Tax=Anncaliia algerae PRA339 TaxID=1288291 RepID=A0A059F4M3_9MICR|nr:hypothetical protein H312_00592 [Anncaliia algerae PRA339]